MTHDMCSTPPRSPTIVGRAVENSIWSKLASSMADMMATMTAGMLLLFFGVEDVLSVVGDV